MKRPAGARRREKSPPLLLVGGFYPLLTPMPLHLAARHFRRLGREVWIVPHSVGSMRDVRQRAALTARYAREVLAKTGAAKLDILAYSMGGLAAIYAIQHFGLADRVRTFVSYGSPYQGTPASLIILIFREYFSLMARQMLPESDLVREILAGGLPPGPRYVSVYGETDWLCPRASAYLPGAKHAHCPFDHLDFLIDPRVCRALEPFLR